MAAEVEMAMEANEVQDTSADTVACATAPASLETRHHVQAIVRGVSAEFSMGNGPPR